LSSVPHKSNGRRRESLKEGVHGLKEGRLVRRKSRSASTQKEAE